MGDPDSKQLYKNLFIMKKNIILGGKLWKKELELF